eukprot:9436881-Pyramimonas_sp.AAC.1
MAKELSGRVQGGALCTAREYQSNRVALVALGSTCCGGEWLYNSGGGCWAGAAAAGSVLPAGGSEGSKRAA